MQFGIGKNFKLSDLTKEDYETFQRFGILGNKKNMKGHVTNDSLVQELEEILHKCPAIASTTKEGFKKKLAYAAQHFKQEQKTLSIQDQVFALQMQQNGSPIPQSIGYQPPVTIPMAQSPKTAIGYSPESKKKHSKKHTKKQKIIEYESSSSDYNYEYEEEEEEVERKKSRRHKKH